MLPESAMGRHELDENENTNSREIGAMPCGQRRHVADTPRNLVDHLDNHLFIPRNFVDMTRSLGL